MKVFFFLLCIAFVRANLVQKALDGGMSPLSAEFVELINKSNLTWKAKKNFEGWDRERLMHLIGTGRNYNETSFDDDLPNCTHSVDHGQMPTNFDARERWPRCAGIIGHIRDQSSCGSCGAVASASAISDRICIASRGWQVQISALDIMTCHNSNRPFFDCAYHPDKKKQDGVFIHQAYRFWRDHGIVSGGDFYDRRTCRPYPIPSFHQIAGSMPSSNGTEARHFSYPDCPTCYKCIKKCVNAMLNYEEDKYWAKEVCRVKPLSEEAIKREIFTYGSVTAQFDVYESFTSYGHGVYQHDEKKTENAHAVKLIGWGEDRGTPYWLAANSWGRSFGDQGFFKILRGKNNCRIEELVYSGIAYV